MVVLRTLGECVIEIGPHCIGPSAPHVFGALLYLGVERGRAVPRARLQAILFPDVEEGRGAHSLRQLVYKLRGHGAPLVTGAEGISLPADAVRDDYSAFLAPAAEPRPDVLRAGGTFLPGYAPRWSAPFARWVESRRDHVHAGMRRTLLAELAEHRRAGRWEAAERTAHACRAIDPLNEEATLALAEVLAVAGSKVKAVRLLDEYIAEAGPGADGMKLPATLLRRRIAERLPSVEYDASRASFVGRAEEMAQLNAVFGESRRGTNRAVVVWGEAGIGKTRLVQEFCKAAALGGATVLRAVSQPHDVRRPMGAFLDLAPQLLGLPGALGTSPEAMRYLQRLVAFDPQLDQPITAEMRDPEYLAACITRALSELLDAVTAEAPLILVMEDAQWLDRVSTMVLGDLLSERRERRLLLVSTWRAVEDPMPGLPFPDRARSIRLSGLAAPDAERLLAGQFRELAVPTDAPLLAWGVNTAQGNPYFLHELARHYAVHREVGAVPASLLELLRHRVTSLSNDARVLLTAIAVLGPYASVSRLSQMVQYARPDLYDALAQLSRASLIATDKGVLQIVHPLVAEIAIHRTPREVCQLLHSHAAETLSREIVQLGAPLALACAEHWLEAHEALRAASALRSCAAHAATLGQHRAGAQLLERALSLTQPPDLRLRLSLDLLTLYDACMDVVAVQRIATHALTESSAFPDLEDLAQVRLFALNARWRSGEDPGSLVDSVHALLESNNTAVRLSAAKIALVLAEELQGAISPTAVYERAKRDLQTLTPEMRDSHPIDLIYHTAFGDAKEAGVIAKRMWSRVECKLNDYSTLVPAVNLLVALGRLGECRQALNVATSLYEAAERAGDRRLLFTIAAIATTTAIEEDTLVTAKAWHERARAALDVGTKSQISAVYLLNDLRISMIEGRSADAETSYAALHKLYPESGSNSRLPTIATGLIVGMRIVARGYASTDETKYLETQTSLHLGDHAYDSVIAAQLDALRLAGCNSAAAEIEASHRANRRSLRAFNPTLVTQVCE